MRKYLLAAFCSTLCFVTASFAEQQQSGRMLWDTNQDGRVSRSEFNIANRDNVPGQGGDFQTFDSNNDGNLDSDELRGVQMQNQGDSRARMRDDSQGTFGDNLDSTTGRSGDNRNPGSSIGSGTNVGSGSMNQGRSGGTGQAGSTGATGGTSGSTGGGSR